MIEKLRDLLMTLPIVRILRGHKEERMESQCLKHELLRENEDIRRRVEIIEWQTLPHTHPQDTTRDDS